MADKIKLILAGLLVAAGIVGYYYFAEQALLYRVLGLLVVIGMSLLVAYQSQPGKDLWSFGSLAILEVRKAVWPTRQETIQTTLLVIVMVVIIGLMLWVFDMFLRWGIKSFLGLGG